MKDKLLIIFTRNPELGKVKTRLAADVGDQNALKVYQFLLEHTVKITKDLVVTKAVYYSEKINENDIWPNAEYLKKQQFGNDLGERMMHAFNQGFDAGYKNIIIIGSDIFDLEQGDIENAFNKLENKDVILGPAQDGGYYLLGLRKLIPGVFHFKKWGTNSVLNDTLADIKNEDYALLDFRNDIDTYEDLKHFNILQALLNN